MNIREVVDKVREMALDYANIDGEHHKQYGLVEIAKLYGAYEDELPEDKVIAP